MIYRSILVVILFCIAATNSIAQSTGEFILKSTPFELLGETAQNFEKYIPQNDTISWEVYVPENYDKNNPPGILVHAGAPKLIEPSNRILNIIKGKNLIWVGARHSGNGNSINQKVMLAMMSVALIIRDYNTDKSRIYVSGEGRTAARTALNYPDIFNGGLITGGNTWEDNAKDKISRVVDYRYVFWGGGGPPLTRNNEFAFNRFKQYGLKGAVRIKRWRGLRCFGKAIDYLDGVDLDKKNIEKCRFR